MKPIGGLVTNTKSAPDNIRRLDTFTTEVLHQLWKVYSVNRDVVDNGRRLENLFWRLWGSERNGKPFSGETVSIIYVGIHSTQDDLVPRPNRYLQPRTSLLASQTSPLPIARAIPSPSRDVSPTATPARPRSPAAMTPQTSVETECPPTPPPSPVPNSMHHGFSTHSFLSKKPQLSEITISLQRTLRLSPPAPTVPDIVFSSPRYNPTPQTPAAEEDQAQPVFFTTPRYNLPTQIPAADEDREQPAFFTTPRYNSSADPSPAAAADPPRPSVLFTTPRYSAAAATAPSASEEKKLSTVAESQVSEWAPAPATTRPSKPVRPPAPPISAASKTRQTRSKKPAAAALAAAAMTARAPARRRGLAPTVRKAPAPTAAKSTAAAAEEDDDDEYEEETDDELSPPPPISSRRKESIAGAWIVDPDFRTKYMEKKQRARAAPGLLMVPGQRAVPTTAVANESVAGTSYIARSGTAAKKAVVREMRRRSVVASDDFLDAPTTNSARPHIPRPKSQLTMLFENARKRGSVSGLSGLARGSVSGASGAPRGSISGASGIARPNANTTSIAPAAAEKRVEVIVECPAEKKAKKVGEKKAVDKKAVDKKKADKKPAKVDKGKGRVR